MAVKKIAELSSASSSVSDNAEMLIVEEAVSKKISITNLFLKLKNKLNIQNNLSSTLTDVPLSANQGKVLNDTKLSRVAFGRTGQDSTYTMISINSYDHWMLTFHVNLYNSYKTADILISGYNYGSYHWYSPLAERCVGNDDVEVYFGWTADYHLYVAFKNQYYTGCSVTNVANGYVQTNMPEDKLFTITEVSSLPGQIQFQTTNRKKADYVIEQGTYDSWTYRKWNSGISECWETINFTTTPGNNQVNSTLPPDLFYNKPTITASCGVSGVAGCSVLYTAVTASGKADIWINNPGGTNSAWINVQVIGK